MALGHTVGEPKSTASAGGRIPVAIVHSTAPVIAITTLAFEAAFPEAALRHLLDSSLYDELDGTAAARKRLGARLEYLIDLAAGAEPAAILVACSSYPRVVDRLGSSGSGPAGIPIVHPDAAMYAETRASGAVRVGVLASVSDAAEAAAYSVMRAYAPATPEITTHVVDRGRRAVDELLAHGARTLVAGGAEAIALAQYSLAPAVHAVAAAVDVPVFSGPLAAARSLRALLVDASR